MALKLYQFAISHYCEKIRWALDYKGLNYETVNLLPGQHVKTIRKLTGEASSVPVLDHDGHVVQGSAAILDYLDQTFPEHPLTPADPDVRERGRLSAAIPTTTSCSAPKLWCPCWPRERLSITGYCSALLSAGLMKSCVSG